MWRRCAALLAVAAAQPDVEDFRPVDEVAQQVISGEISPKQLVDMLVGMPPEYVRDVKHSLPDELKRQVKEIIYHHEQMVDVEPAADPEPAGEEEEEEEEDYTYDYEEEEDGADGNPEGDLEDDAEEPAEEELEPELAPVEEPIQEEDSPTLRAGPVLRADVPEEGSTRTWAEAAAVAYPKVSR